MRLASCRLGYGDLMQSLVDGKTSSIPGNGGHIAVEQFVVETSRQKLVFPEISYHSEGNNANLNDAVSLLQVARENNAYGDYMYLWSYVKHEGAVSLTVESPSTEDICNIGPIDDVLPFLVFTTSNMELRSYYMSLILLGDQVSNALRANTLEDENAGQEVYQFINQG